jgi:cytochrome P450
MAPDPSSTAPPRREVVADPHAPLEYDPGAYAIQEDPFPIYRWLRDAMPLYRNERRGFWALTRFDDVHGALGDPATYSSAHGVQLEQSAETLGFQAEMILNMDPPRHGDLRQLVSRAFTPRRMAALEEPIRSECRALLDDLAERGGGDLVDDYAAIVPATVIAALVGLAPGDRVALRQLTDRVNHREPGSIAPPADADRAGIDLYKLFAGLVERRRAEPADDLASALLATERLTDVEMVMFDLLLAVAGYETASKLIANLGVALARDRAQRQLLLDDPSLAAAAIEESLRHDGSSHYVGRVTTRDAQWHGDVIPEGSRVLLVLGAANRDDREFDDPDRLDVRRHIRRHVAFGHGIHFCLGAALARLEARIALQELLARLPDHEIDLTALERKYSTNFRGYSRVPITTA